MCVYNSTELLFTCKELSTCKVFHRNNFKIKIIFGKLFREYSTETIWIQVLHFWFEKGKTKTHSHDSSNLHMSTKFLVPQSKNSEHYLQQL